MHLRSIGQLRECPAMSLQERVRTRSCSTPEWGAEAKRSAATARCAVVRGMATRPVSRVATWPGGTLLMLTTSTDSRRTWVGRKLSALTGSGTFELHS